MQQPVYALSPAVRDMRNSATVAIKARVRTLLGQGHTVHDLGFGQSPFPIPAPVVAALREHAHEQEYLPVAGLRALREAVAAYHARRGDADRSADDVLIGPGSKPLMYFLQLACDAELVLASPSWVTYAPQARMLGRPVRTIATKREHGFRVRPEDLDRLCAEDPGRPRLFVLNYPNNPTGATYSADELRGLAEVARKYRLVVLSDEIYGELHFTGEHVSLARFYPEGTILSSGLSKWCGAGGWRLGHFSFPPEMRPVLDAMTAAMSECITSTAAPVQYAAVEAYRPRPELDAYLVHSRRILRSLGTWVADTLRAAGVHCASPAGGFYVFPDFGDKAAALKAKRGVTTAAELSRTLLAEGEDGEAKVAILPGSDFGRPESELSARLAYVSFDGDAALHAAAALPAEEALDAAFLEAHCRSVLDAVRALCAWLP